MMVTPVTIPVVFPQSANMGPIVSTSLSPLPPGDYEPPGPTAVSIGVLLLAGVDGWLYSRAPELKNVCSEQRQSRLSLWHC
jgi:hypothetical protein